MKSTTYLAATLATLASAAPTKRATGIDDPTILNYALTLEHLESAFYTQALQNFTAADFTAAGYADDVYTRIETLAADEATHVTFLTGALKAANATPVSACTYAFGVTSPASLLATASILEGVGVSAYLGAAADIMTKGYLTAAASILAVEARHSAFIRGVNKEAPFPAPFDTPLGYNEVYSLAAPFFVECPASNPALPVKAFPKLMAEAEMNGEVVKAGSSVVLKAEGHVTEGEVYVAFITLMGPQFVDAEKVKDGLKVMVPEGVTGQSYIVLTSCNGTATDDTIVAGPAILEVAN